MNGGYFVRTVTALLVGLFVLGIPAAGQDAPVREIPGGRGAHLDGTVPHAGKKTPRRSSF